MTSMKKEHQLQHLPIYGHSFNHDMTQLVIGDTTNNATILKKGADGKYVKDCELSQHIKSVKSVDWAPKSNRIVTCAGDRNAYVWNLCVETGEWKPSLVLLRIDRAATYVRWAPSEDRFAVGSGARLLSVCYFDPEHDWWVSKHIKKPIRSTILSVDWHPSNMIIAIGSCDFKCRVFSAALKEREDKPTISGWMPKLSKFGVMLSEFTDSTGWVHGIKFSPSGDMLAWVSHDASINLVSQDSQDKVIRLLTSSLPLLSIVWLSESSIVAAGHDNAPLLFNVTDDKQSIVLGAKLDVDNKKAGAGMSAMARFKQLDTRGADADNKGTKLNTTHQNAINEVRICETGQDGKAKSFSTVGKDGKLVIWNIDALSAAISALKI